MESTLAQNKVLQFCHIDFAGSSQWSIQGWEHDQTFILVFLIFMITCLLFLDPVADDD